MSEQIRTRIAPSPTGYIHIGTIRTALYAWLLARQNDGVFILRVEDTDKKREVENGVEIIKKTLEAVNFTWDEYYLQSERKEIHRKWAEELHKKGLAYADNVTPEEVEAWREDAKLKRKPFLYRDYITEERKVDWVYGQNSLRLKSNPKRWDWHDEVRGDLSAGAEAIDDFALIKSDGFATYNFCHIVDDHEMGITHIFRTDEFLASTPKYLNLYETLEIEPPKFVTLPPIMAPGGKKKLGKRDGAKSALQYLDEGILIEGLINFLALLGWNPGKGNNQEIFTIDQLIKDFSIEGIGKSGANYDEKRLEWINGHHIRALSLDELYNYCHPELDSGSKKTIPLKIAESHFPETYQKQVLSLVQERLKLLSEIPELTWFFFKKPEISKAELLDVKGLENLTPSSNYALPPAHPLSEEASSHLTPNPSPTREGSSTVDSVDQIYDKTFTTNQESWAKLKDLARDNRKNPTKAEDALWQQIRNSKLGLKFRRQHSIDGFIVDFFNTEKGLVIEVDGGYHNDKEQKLYDAMRQKLIEEYGITFVRFTNQQIESDIQTVLSLIKNVAAPLSSWRGVGGEVSEKPGGAKPAQTMLTHTLNLIQQTPDDEWDAKTIQAKLNQALEDLETKPAILFALLRNALTGAKFTPPLHEMMAVLGKEEVKTRLTHALSLINS
jgi:nondiscriminating glutamyl-tRNA synthetase